MGRNASLAKGLRWGSKMLESIRRYAWTGQNGRRLYSSIRLQPRYTVVDVGCGTGTFTRVVAEGLDENKGGKIVGIDRNPQLLTAARRISREEGYDRRFMVFKAGDAKAIPLPDNYADRVVCQALLWLMTDSDRVKALNEMIRICKKGGLVAAVEGATDSFVAYFPDDGRLTDLEKKSASAQLKGYQVVHGYDRAIGYKLPIIFRQVGLTKVRLDGVAWIELQSDERVPLDYRLSEHRRLGSSYKQWLSKLEHVPTIEGRKRFVEKTEPSLTAGGLSWEEVVELARLNVSYHGRLAENPDSIREDTSVQAGIGFITTGIKT
jgi:ubiquinone/menaquinone biosynthesis C-methylase UbiE